MLDAPITLTEKAVASAATFQKDEPAFQGLDLRVYLSGKGCDGFDYGVTFDQRMTEDLAFKVSDRLSVICDPSSIEFLQGSSIDWVDDERGRGFLVQNPNHRKFRGKFYKKTEILKSKYALYLILCIRW
jgi:iron-sulfur cluster insertion protein